jgi:type IV pilus assembly protein PilW
MKRRFAGRSSGFGLVELMVALVLGLIVVGGAVSVFASNRQAFRATEGLSRLQENARVGFEIMTRDVRDAGGTPCSKRIPVANVLNGGAGNWMYDWDITIRGFEPANVVGSLPAVGDDGARAAGTDALVVHSGGTASASIEDHDEAGGTFQLNTADHGLRAGDLAIVCDYRQATLLQLTAVAGQTLTFGAGAGTPGNCSSIALAFPTNCAAGSPNYEYQPNSVVSRLTSVAWYVGDKTDGGRALYRMVGGATEPEEIVDGVRDLELSYLWPGQADYADANLVPNWADVTAVRIQFEVVSPETVGTDGQPLARNIVHFVALRNRNQ